MPRRQRHAVYLVLVPLWLSGCAWLLLDQFFQRPGEFGPMPHPWQPPLLLLHGCLAIAGMYLLGWVSARHVLRWWSSGRRRWSGITLAVLCGSLALCGFALFFLSDDRWQHVCAAAHDILGIAVTLIAVQHWFLARRSDMRSAASRP